MSKYKYCIKSEASDLKLIPHPKKSLKITAGELTNKYADLFPKDQKPDITYFSAVSFTIGHVNKNNCLVLPDEGIKNYKTAIATPLDLEHEKEQIVGFCINSYLSNIKNNKILTEEEAQQILDGKGQVNVGAVFGIWGLNNPEIDSLIRENFDDNSENFNKIKVSFECYFNDYCYFVSNGSADYPNGEVYSHDNPDANEMWDVLRTNGGNGIFKGNKISICPLESFIGGNGLVLNPANELSVTTSISDNGDITLQNVQAEASTTDLPSVPLVSEELDNKNETKSVILNKEENMSKENTITEPANVEVATMAPVKVDADMANALQAEMDKKIAEISAKDAKILELDSKMTETIKAMQDAVEASKAEALKATEMATKIQAQLDAEIENRKNLEAHENARKQTELVASRLATLAAFIEITEANKALLEKECAEASDEEFAKKVEFYKSLSPKVVVASEVVKTEVDVKATVQNAVTETAKDAKSVNVITPTPSDSLMDKFAAAFNVESLGFKFKS